MKKFFSPVSPKRRNILSAAYFEIFKDCCVDYLHKGNLPAGVDDEAMLKEFIVNQLSSSQQTELADALKNHLVKIDGLAMVSVLDILCNLPVALSLGAAGAVIVGGASYHSTESPYSAIGAGFAAGIVIFYASSLKALYDSKQREESYLQRLRNFSDIFPLGEVPQLAMASRRFN